MVCPLMRMHICVQTAAHSMIEADLEAALQQDAHLQRALPQRFLTAHSSAFGALLGCAVCPICDGGLILRPGGLQFPL